LSTRGFTLIEVLLALMIAALLVTIGYRGLTQLLDSEQRLAEQSERWRALDRFFARLESDLRKAVPRGVRGPEGSEPAFILAGSGDNGRYASLLRFSRAGGENMVAAAGQRLDYRLADGKVEIVYWPYLDNPSASANVAYALVDGVESLRIQALTATSEWTDAWPAVSTTDALPRAIRVEVRLASGESLQRWYALQP
jgi:general secretion pathway protein J